MAPFNWAKFHILIYKFSFKNHLHHDKSFISVSLYGNIRLLSALI